MKYRIYQIAITSEESREINEMENPRENHPKYKDYTHALFEEWDQINPKHYQHVADIVAEDLDEVFAAGNSSHYELSITRYAPMHSISVGDIIVDEAGNQFGVAGFGFIELKDMV